MFKILVPLKRVPDYEIKIKIKPDGSGIETDGIKWIVNPFDEIAVEEAVRFKESKGSDVEITILSIGPEETTEQIRTALAMGADKGVLVKTSDYLDSFAAAEIIAHIYQKESYNLVLMGKQAIDSDANQTAQLIAAKLELAQATFASKLEISEDNQTANVTREVDGGLETIKVTLPAVVSTDLRLNEPRYPSLPGIVKAKKKPLELVELNSLGLSNIEPKVKVLKLSPPEERKAGVILETVDQLIDKLKNESKVI